MGWWKADPTPEPPQLPQSLSHSQSQQTAALIPPHPIPAHPSTSTGTSTSTDPAAASACPIDPSTRAIWLQQAQKVQQQQAKRSPSSSPSPGQIPGQPDLPARTSPPSPPPAPSPSPSLRDITTTSASVECSSDRIDQYPTAASQSASAYSPSRPLSHDRVVSSIPRATTTGTFTTPANSETETGPHPSGNWIYPSESQFFHAVMRKQTLSTSSPETLASSISSIIPIHNAVNERAWTLIKEWEVPATEATRTKSCAGPKLLKFQGLGAGPQSPKARILGLCGYTAPFDRHDWTVERCDGRRVEYVIDFYQGKAQASEGRSSNNNLNFYLDVRPKLNTVEGWRMRAEKVVGWR
ncbi:cytochrome c heme-lyase [Cladophialophora yegresii CBS 114405]|uniref:Holocytochrome c-type synthase n=1 Tax=Cladophialophora yegresii CBS 114405 TaxID=1182544 RepID=W9VT15_9EURO|nr:cytochrome c heme-lyase [Cladophialophora yegresii CBS 114405]EXJ58713.1 cytochrome c heme-lyase [Cladophialophora yegresii CBS 114405]